jgi:hypothetical protein
MLGKLVVAWGDAPRDLKIKEAVAHPIAPDQLAHDQLERAARHRPGDPQFAQRAVEAVQVPGRIDHQAGMDGDHLVDTVGELIAAVLAVNRRLAMRHVATADIGVAGHDEVLP